MSLRKELSLEKYTAINHDFHDNLAINLAPNTINLAEIDSFTLPGIGFRI